MPFVDQLHRTIIIPAPVSTGEVSPFPSSTTWPCFRRSPVSTRSFCALLALELSMAVPTYHLGAAPRTLIKATMSSIILVCTCNTAFDHSAFREGKSPPLWSVPRILEPLNSCAKILDRIYQLSIELVTQERWPMFWTVEDWSYWYPLNRRSSTIPDTITKQWYVLMNEHNRTALK